MIGRDELWRDLENSLKSLVESMPAKFDGKNRELLNEFAENREFGVALEWLHSIIVERSIELSAQQEQEIQRLANLMGIRLPDSGELQ
jgi:hypothetical protein